MYRYGTPLDNRPQCMIECTSMRDLEYPPDVVVVVEEIRIKGMSDDESAHILEDNLHVAVLRAIAWGTDCQWTKDMALEALETCDLDFERWCA